MTVKRIIVEYLKSKVSDEVSTSEIELNCVQFGQQLYGKLHPAGMYNRAWRLIREDRSLLREASIDVEEINNDSREKHFKIRRIQCSISKLPEGIKTENHQSEI